MIRVRPSFTCFVLTCGLLPDLAVADEKAQRVVPPPHVIDGLTKVVIVQLDGASSEAATSALSQAIRTRLGFDSRLAVADAGLRADVADFVQETAVGSVSLSQVADWSARHGAQVVVSLRGSGSVTEENSYVEERTITTINPTTKESESRKITVSCFKRSVAATTAAWIYDASGAEIARKNLADTLEDKDCDEDGSGEDSITVADAGAMISGLIGRQAVSVGYTFLPHYERFTYDLVLDPNNKDFVKMARDGNWPAATAGSMGVLADDPYNASAVHLIATALELGGRTADAVPVYALANRMGKNPTFGTSEARARQRLAELALLERAYGQHAERAEVPGSDELVKRARGAQSAPQGGMPAMMVGTKAKRYPIFEAADLSSAIVTTVPGGVEVRRVKDQGGLTQIVLPDGVTGWVDSKVVK